MNHLSRYLENWGYKVKEIEMLEIGGMTDTQFFGVVTTTGDELFVKSGEKVDNEVVAIKELLGIGCRNLPTLLRGSSHEQRILVTDRIKIKTTGMDLATSQRLGSIDSAEFTDFQDQVLNNIVSLHGSKRPVASPDVAPHYAKLRGRLDDLWRADSPIRALGGLSIRNIMELPLVSFSDGATEHIGSLAEIAIRTLEIAEQVTFEKFVPVHGDFHPPNTLVDLAGGVRVVDWSDARLADSPSWDIAKWSNFAGRFVDVAIQRINEIEADSTIEDGLIYAPYRQSEIEFRGALIEVIGDTVGIEHNLLDNQTALSEVVVNFSTLLRHANRFPHTILSVVKCIVNSFLDLRKKTNGS